MIVASRSMSSEYSVLMNMYFNHQVQHSEDAMIKAGFVGIDSEWWHFTLKDEPYKDTYFNFDVQ